MLGIVIPAHNGQERIGASVTATLAAHHMKPVGAAAEVQVVPDDCHGATGVLAADSSARRDARAEGGFGTTLGQLFAKRPGRAQRTRGT